MKVVDMHCDTISEIYNRRREGKLADLCENDLSIDLKRMKKGDYLLQNFALFTHMKQEKEPYQYAKNLANTLMQELEKNKDQIRLVKSWQEIEENTAQGRMSALMTIEEGGVCEGKLSRLREFYELGVRMMTLTWNFPNELGFPNARVQKSGTDRNVFRSVPDTEHGLTDTGIEFLQEMERLGMIVDISHLNDAGIWDVFEHTKKPFVASHSNCRALASHPRNLTDPMIRALADRGGVAGINYCASFLCDEENGREPVHSSCADMVRHMKHMKQIGGIECIGLGSDFDGISSIVEMKDCSGMQHLAEEMEQQGFGITEIEKVFYGNVLRLYRERL